MTFHKKHSKGQGKPRAAESTVFTATSNKIVHANLENLAVPWNKAFALRLNATASTL